MNREENLTTGFIRENSVLSLYLGFCPTLTITATLNSAIGTGAVAIIVLITSNMIISLIRNITPSEIRTPVYIVTAVTLVKIIQMSIEAYAPGLDSALGVSTPLVVVNCVILGHAKVFASKNSVLDSALDGLGMGLGYVVLTILMSAIRQVIATGILPFDNPFDAAQSTLLIRIIPEDFAIFMFSQPFGAFCMLACLTAGLTAYKSHQQDKAKELEREVKQAMNRSNLFMMLVTFTFINNAVLNQSLGTYSSMGVSRRSSSTVGTGAVVIFVIVAASLATYGLHYMVPNPLGFQYTDLITFILVVVALVQLVEMIVKEPSPSLYKVLGVYLPLIAIDCVALNVTPNNIISGYNFAEMLAHSIVISIGFTMMLYIFSTIREHLDACDTPFFWKGNPIALIVVAIVTFAFDELMGLV